MSNERINELIVELDALYARVTPGSWTPCGCGKCGRVHLVDGVTVLTTPHDEDSLCVSAEQASKNSVFIAGVHNGWPDISGRLKELKANPGLRAGVALESEAVEALRRAIRDREAEQLATCAELDEANARITLLETENNSLCEAISRFELAYHESGDDDLVNEAIDGLTDAKDPWVRRELGAKPEPTAQEQRITLLEQTLRGILDEKQTDRFFVSGPGVVEHAKREFLDKQIAHLESVLGGTR